MEYGNKSMWAHGTPMTWRENFTPIKGHSRHSLRL
jgi:hypothetical protein